MIVFICLYQFVSVYCENKYDCHRKWCSIFVETVSVLFFVYYDVCVCKLLFERAISLISGSGKKCNLKIYVCRVFFYARLDTDLVLLSRIDWLFRLTFSTGYLFVIFFVLSKSPESLKFILFGVIKCQGKGFYNPVSYLTNCCYNYSSERTLLFVLCVFFSFGW